MLHLLQAGRRIGIQDWKEAEAPTCHTANSNLLHLEPLLQMLHLVHLVKAGIRIGILDWKEAEAAA